MVQAAIVDIDVRGLKYSNVDYGGIEDCGCGGMFKVDVWVVSGAVSSRVCID